MKIDLEKLQKEYFPVVLESIKAIIKISSVCGEKAPQATFGKNTKKVLDFAINLAKKLGFKGYQDPENRYVYVNMEAVKKSLKDHGFKPDYWIHLIFGLTEETNWASITSYMKTKGTPDLGYIPDMEFPVVYSEKGILNVDIIAGSENFILIGGEAYNSVNDLIKYQGPEISKIEAILTTENIENYVEKDMLIIKGKSSHGSLPERGVNAALEALNAISHVNPTSKISKFVE